MCKMSGSVDLPHQATIHCDHRKHSRGRTYRIFLQDAIGFTELPFPCPVAPRPGHSTATGIRPIRACHSRGPVRCTDSPVLSTATVTGMSFTSNS